MNQFLSSDFRCNEVFILYDPVSPSASKIHTDGFRAKQYNDKREASQKVYDTSFRQECPMCPI